MPDSYPDMSGEVRTRVAKRLSSAPTADFQSDYDTASDDEWGPSTSKRHKFKSGKIRTADTLVTKRIVWLYEVVYTSSGQPVMYLG